MDKPATEDYTPHRCTVVPARGAGGFPGISTQSTGAERMSLRVLTFGGAGTDATAREQADAESGAHLHERHEMALYVVSGTLAARYGDWLQESAIARAGELVHIPAGVPHTLESLSGTQPCVVVVACTDPREQPECVPLPELDARETPRDASRDARNAA